MTAERRESMLTAVESSDGFDNLRILVKLYLDEGIRAEQLLDDLSQIRALVSDDVEELVLDVMDLLVGWCAPEFRLVHKQKDELGLSLPQKTKRRAPAQLSGLVQRLVLVHHTTIRWPMPVRRSTG